MVPPDCTFNCMPQSTVLEFLEKLPMQCTGWPFHLFKTSRWLQNKSSALAWPGQAKAKLLFWSQREVLNNWNGHPVLPLDCLLLAPSGIWLNCNCSPFLQIPGKASIFLDSFLWDWLLRELRPRRSWRACLASVSFRGSSVAVSGFPLSAMCVWNIVLALAKNSIREKESRIYRSYVKILWEMSGRIIIFCKKIQMS